MIKNHLLIFFIATVTFGICESANSHRNYNVNTNINSNMPGALSGRPSREDIRNRDRYYLPLQESFPEGPNLGEMKTREKWYPPTKYSDYATGVENFETGDTIDHDPEDGFYQLEYFPDDGFDTDNSKPEYDVDIFESDGGYGGDVCDDGKYYPVARNRLSHDEWNARLKPYPISWKASPSFNDEPQYRRSNNWGFLMQPEGSLRRPHVQPAIGSNPKGAYKPQKNGFGTGNESPSFPKYSPPTYVSAGQYSTRRPPVIRKPKPNYLNQWQRPNDKISENQYEDPYMPSGGSSDDEYENDGGYMEYGAAGGRGNANINTNSNINIMTRRMKPRGRRSVDHQSKNIFVAPNVDHEATTKVLIEESSTTVGPKA